MHHRQCLLSSKVSKQGSCIHTHDNAPLGANDLIVSVQHCSCAIDKTQCFSRSERQRIERINAGVQSLLAKDWLTVELQPHTILRRSGAVA
jgi:hypothetical protein